MKKTKYGWIWTILSIVVSMGLVVLVYMVCGKKDEI